LIAYCVENGITTFDHADIYGDYIGEQLFGEALADSGTDRTKIQLVTKCGIRLISKRRPDHRVKSYDTSREHIVASVERSLESLRTEYIDLLLIHRPDPLMDPHEVNAAFTALRKEGKVRFFGVSNFTAAQFAMLAARVEVPLVTNQIEYSVMHLDAQADGTLDLCQQLGIRPMAWSPLGGGRLFHEDGAQAKRLRDTLHRVGHDLGGASVDQVALAWLLKHPAQFVPVLGTGKASRIRRAVDALRLALSREQWFAILEASTGQEVA
jgi:predicted oxidoreductase